MKKVKIELENCYGIKKFKHEFDFNNGNTQIVYAPNGTMKTSLRKTFTDLKNKKESGDCIKQLRGKRIIKDEEGNDIKPEDILVFETLDEAYTPENMEKLLLNADLSKEYDSLNDELEEKKVSLFKNIKLSYGLSSRQKEDLMIKEFCESMSFKNSTDIYKALNDYESIVKRIIEDNSKIELINIEYNKIFNKDTEKIIGSDDFKNNIKAYLDCLDKIFDNTVFFKKGTFYKKNADDVYKALTKNNFFDAEHTININGIKDPIDKKEKLKDAIENELARIINDPELQKIHNTLTDMFKNEGQNAFKEYLNENPFLVEHLENIDLLKKELWASYLAKEKTHYFELLDIYSKNQKRLQELEEEAKKNTGLWGEVVNTFNARYSVPFTVELKNPVGITLHNEESRGLKYIVDGNEVDEKTLKNCLSMGEKRALYLLNILFEVKARGEDKTLIIFDDIADSFDYKNKYAIIEYLRDLNKILEFKLLILTHNFDFYRTATKRLDIKKTNRQFAVKNSNSLTFEYGPPNNDIFNNWKDGIKTGDITPKTFIATIPFFRNIAEYTLSQNSHQFKFFTSLLHQKNGNNHNPKTNQIRVKDVIDEIGTFTTYINSSTPFKHLDQNELMIDLIYKEADNITATEGLNLVEKIIISIAIRLKAEEYMLSKIGAYDSIENLESNQTPKLIDKFAEKFPSDTEQHDRNILDTVNLMTPESIHLNSFMYEPLIDMSIGELKRLYKNLKSLIESE